VFALNLTAGCPTEITHLKVPIDQVVKGWGVGSSALEFSALLAPQSDSPSILIEVGGERRVSTCEFLSHTQRLILQRDQDFETEKDVWIAAHTHTLKLFASQNKSAVPRVMFFVPCALCNRLRFKAYTS
jgi:hypothetical protein